MDILELFTSIVALILLEIILGIDNLVFLAILTEKLPQAQRRKARRWGLMFAWVTRLFLLVVAMAAVHLTQPLFSVDQWTFSIRELFMLIGGGFLITKATQEIHSEVSPLERQEHSMVKASDRFYQVVFQVGLMDIIFSFDSILTAVGLTNHFWVMALAITIAIMVMIFASEPISYFIQQYPTIKMLALSFLMLIGMVLVADGFSFHIPRGYVYFAMAFSLSVEGLHGLRRYRRRLIRGKKHVDD